ncbi:amidohydrolase family protein [Nocardioides sp. YIM 152315]|uniref:dihydroorotase n=1 Tax=Nocardioides sp. YIM 152315 TaxID=3031760 RepID=UPI0023DB29BA|nr:amidohydrolase family protein [Nocardioides sp. YIM 152315]MDF1605829.1 amidohydrolase family protein [Nocardioides sp. YIM 152315]
MSKVQLVVKDARIVVPEAGVLTGHVVVDDGKVVALLSSDEAPPEATRTIDAAGRYVLPGALDAHCHYGLMPPMRERMAPETGFAAIGGVTTLIRYYRRTDSYLDTFPAHIEQNPAYHYQDFSAHLALFNQSQVEEIPRYISELGITSFKLYMNLKANLAKAFLIDPLVDDEVAQTEDLDYDDGLLFGIMQKLASQRVRTRLSVHVEEADLVSYQLPRVKESGLGGLLAWHYARPAEAEALGVQKVAYLSRQLNVPVYFPHIGSRLGLDALRAEAERGTDMVIETCPHYLVHNISSPAAELLKVMPPVRTDDDNRATWEAIESGLISTVCTDHIPYNAEEKNLGDIWTTRPAFGSIGLMVAVLISAGVNGGHITIQRAAELLSTNTAKTFGFYPQKGTLLPGSDADLMIIDPDARWTVHANDFPSAQPFSVYENMELTGRVDVTISRGDVIAENGQLQVEPGRGRFLRRDADGSRAV